MITITKNKTKNVYILHNKMSKKFNTLTSENALKPEKPYCYKDIQYYKDIKICT